MTRPAPGPFEVVLFNPLPKALRHYAEALGSNLAAAGVASTVISTDLEIGGAGRVGKLRRLFSGVGPMLRAARAERPVIVVWPIFGLLDILLWRVLSPRSATRLVIVHDPIPLRRQFGYSARAARLAAWASKDDRVEVVTHTAVAAQVLREQGINTGRVLPHPVLGVARQMRGKTAVVLVAGQYKESRDLAILERLGRADHRPWDLQVVGRGWPAIEGWTVDARFVTEEELDHRLASSSAVLIPYSHYFQSGIATRCCELAVPVVAQRHEFIESLYGTDWPGFVEEDTIPGWLDAVSRAVVRDVSPDDAIAVATDAWREVFTPATKGAR